MRKTLFIISLIALTFTSCVENNTAGLKLSKKISLPDVKGSFDLMAADIEGNRLFVAAQDNHSLEVIDLSAMKLLKTLPNFEEPKWVVYRPETNRVYVATAIDAKVTVLDSRTFDIITSYVFKEKCNNLRFDPTTNLLYVGVGKTNGSIGIIDVKKDSIVGEISLASYPKQFEIVGNKMYINEPEINSIEIADLTLRKVIAKWKVQEAGGNVPMGIDRIHQRLFIGCETGKMVVYDLEKDKAIATVDISKEADGIYYDVLRSRIYVSCGEGFIDVINQTSPDKYLVLSKIATRRGAGTSLFVPKLDMFILAVPQNAQDKAEIRIYKPLTSQ